MTLGDTPRTSLRTRLLRHVIPPLLLTWGLGAALALSIATYFTQRAFDRAMLDDAYLIAAHLGTASGELTLNMSGDELQTVLFDQSEHVFFAVLDGQGRLVAGHVGLRPDDDATAEPRYVDLNYQGRDLRAVVLRRELPRPATIVVALTTHSRRALLHQLILYSAVPQGLLLVGLALWLRRSIRLDLRPLSDLRELVEARDTADLSPLPRDLLDRSASRDVHGLAVAIDALLGRVAQGLASRREFAGTVAHELRTPLAGIRALAEYGLSQREPEQWREQLQAILQSQHRASRQVEQLLAMALADEAGTAVQLKPLDLAACARDVLLRRLPQADAAGFELEATGLDGPAWILADTALVEGLLGNLLDNALRYGRLPGEPGQVLLSLRRLAGQVELGVTDRGPGIPAELRERLKARWAQGAEGTRQGTGLGLAIVQRYAELLRGEFHLEDGPQGRGLLATVTFPSHPAPTLPPP